MSSLRMPQTFLKKLGVETGDAVFRHELLEEQAQSLGRAGRKVEAALAALSAHEGGEGRAALVKAAADAVWGFLVQREVCVGVATGGGYSQNKMVYCEFVLRLLELQVRMLISSHLGCRGLWSFRSESWHP